MQCFRLFSFLVAALTAVAPVRALGAETFTWQGDGGFSRTFPLRGGTYEIYVNAHYLPSVYNHTRGSCVFGGAFEQLSPKTESVHLGPALPLSTAIHYNIGPKTITLSPGRYRLFIASSTDCRWRFTLTS